MGSDLSDLAFGVDCCNKSGGRITFETHTVLCSQSWNHMESEKIQRSALKL